MAQEFSEIMQLHLTIHLPGVTLETDSSTLGPGRVGHLPFEEWLRLDPTFPHVESKYQKAHPTFWIGEIPMGNDTGNEEILKLGCELSWNLHCAFLLEPRVPWLPSPALSVRYLTVKGHPAFPDGVEGPPKRLIGPAEREWVVFGSPVSVPYDPLALAQVAREFEWMARLDLDSAFGGVHAALAVLERTARPDSWWGSDEYLHSVNDFVHCMAACEGMLLADDTVGDNDTITDTFGKQAAVVTARTQDELASFARHWSDLYRLRSRLVHGRIGLSELEDVQRARLPQARTLLRALIKAAIAFKIEARSDDTLPALLTQALADSTAYAALRNRLEEAT